MFSRGTIAVTAFVLGSITALAVKSGYNYVTKALSETIDELVSPSDGYINISTGFDTLSSITNANQEQSPLIVVVGSSNADIYLETPTIPRVGETTDAALTLISCGGKGANQATSASKSIAVEALKKYHNKSDVILSQPCQFVSVLGSDNYSQMFLSEFHKQGLNTKLVLQVHDIPTGQAYIILDAQGHNSILICPGANLMFPHNYNMYSGMYQAIYNNQNNSITFKYTSTQKQICDALQHIDQLSTSSSSSSTQNDKNTLKEPIDYTKTCLNTFFPTYFQQQLLIDAGMDSLYTSPQIFFTSNTNKNDKNASDISDISVSQYPIYRTTNDIINYPLPQQCLLEYTPSQLLQSFLTSTRVVLLQREIPDHTNLFISQLSHHINTHYNREEEKCLCTKTSSDLPIGLFLFDAQNDVSKDLLIENDNKNNIFNKDHLSMLSKSIPDEYKKYYTHNQFNERRIALMMDSGGMGSNLDLSVLQYLDVLSMNETEMGRTLRQAYAVNKAQQPAHRVLLGDRNSNAIVDNSNNTIVQDENLAYFAYNNIVDSSSGGVYLSSATSTVDNTDASSTDEYITLLSDYTIFSPQTYYSLIFNNDNNNKQFDIQTLLPFPSSSSEEIKTALKQRFDKHLTTVDVPLSYILRLVPPSVANLLKGNSKKLSLDKIIHAGNAIIGMANRLPFQSIPVSSTLGYGLGNTNPLYLLVTIGQYGSLLLSYNTVIAFQPALSLPSYRIVDSTGCGDSYRGAFAAAYVEHVITHNKNSDETSKRSPIQESGCINWSYCMKIATAAASVCIGRKGTTPAMGTREEIDILLKEFF